MLRASRLQAGRIYLLFAVVIWSASVLGFAAGADPARAAAFPYASGADSLLPATGLTTEPAVPRRASKRRKSPRKSSPGRRTGCAATASGGRDREARKACAVGKKKKASPTKPNGSEPSVARAPAGVKPPLLLSPFDEPNSTPALVIDGAPPVEALKVEPVEPTTPVGPATPSEPSPPVEESKPPVEEEKAKEEKAREEKANEVKANEEKAREEKAKEAKANEEKAKEVKAEEKKVEEKKAEEEAAKEAKAKEEAAKEVKAKEVKSEEEKAKEEKAREIKAQEEKAKEEKAREEKAKEVKAAEEKAKEEQKLKEEKLKEEKAKEQRAREEKANEEKAKEVKAGEERAQEEKAEEEKPVELKAPIEPVAPVEESKPSAEEKASEEKAREEKAQEEKVKEEAAKEVKAEEEKAREVKAEEERTREEKAAEEKAKEVKAEEEKASEEKVREEKASEEKAQEEKVKEEKAKEAKAAEVKAEEEKAAEKKAAEEKAKEEKASEEKAEEEKAKAVKAEEEKAKEVKAQEEKAKEEKAKEEAAAPFRFFSPTSFWNEELPADAPLDPSSAGVVGAFAGQITAAYATKKGEPFINTTSYSVPIYTVSDTQATVKVAYEIPYGGKANPALEAAWDAVPLPAEAKPARGTDRHLVVWQPSTDKLWEFWGLEKTGAGWQAKWGGAIEKASSDSGAYGPEAWPGAQPGWGASASSLSIAGGLITLEDLEKGQINHALAIALPNVRAGVYASPAQRSDGGSTEPLSLPEGAHLRLDPSLDLASLHLPKLTLMLAEAAQRYGIVVRDQAEEPVFYGQDPTPTGTEPYTGAHGYFEGKSPSQILASFPWSHLQLLKMELH